MSREPQHRSDHFDSVVIGNIVLNRFCSFEHRAPICSMSNSEHPWRRHLDYCGLCRRVRPAAATIRRRIMNRDQVSGKVEQAVGKVKQSVGEAFGNHKLANQGVVDQAKGAAKETWGNAKDAANEVKQSHQNVATDKAQERRNKISQSVKNAKDRAREKIDEFKERHSA
jgi:uncharacterized protein YjbJ (UPF0337 family)